MFLRGCMGEILNTNQALFKTEIVPMIDGNSVYDAILIVLMDKNTGELFEITQYSDITLTTDLYKKRKNTRINVAKTIVQFLNYTFFDREFIRRDIVIEENIKNKKIKSLKKIEDLRIEDFNIFLNDYKRGAVGANINKERSSIEQVMSRLLHLFYFLIRNFKMKYIKSSDIKTKLVYFNDNGQIKQKESVEAPFSVILPDEGARKKDDKKRLQNVSFFVVAELINIAAKYKPMISLTIAEQAFAGLRGSEACNTTKFNTSFRYLGNELVEWSVDLRKKPTLRSDGVDVGGIKSREIAQVHPAFLPFFDIVKNEHENYINNVFRKKNEYGAMFMTRDGKAMTNHDYWYHFTGLVKKLVLQLRKYENYRLIGETEIIALNKLTPHTLRYFFSQMVASMPDVTIFDVAMFRRDKTLTSAMSYIRNNPYLIDDKVKAVQRELMRNVKR